MQFQAGHVQQYLRYLKDLVLRQRDVLERAKQELIAYKELQRCPASLHGCGVLSRGLCRSS